MLRICEYILYLISDQTVWMKSWNPAIFFSRNLDNGKIEKKFKIKVGIENFRKYQDIFVNDLYVVNKNNFENVFVRFFNMVAMK